MDFLNPETVAARLLHDHFYEWWESQARPGEYIPKIRVKGGVSVVPYPYVQWALDLRREELLPAGFRFTWSNLPDGAHYVVD